MNARTIREHEALDEMKARKLRDATAQIRALRAERQELIDQALQYKRDRNEFKKDRDLIADAKQRADDEVQRLRGAIRGISEVVDLDPDKARRLISRALANEPVPRGVAPTGEWAIMLGDRVDDYEMVAAANLHPGDTVCLLRHGVQEVERIDQQGESTVIAFVVHDRDGRVVHGVGLQTTTLDPHALVPRKREG